MLSVNVARGRQWKNITLPHAKVLDETTAIEASRLAWRDVPRHETIKVESPSQGIGYLVRNNRAIQYRAAGKRVRMKGFNMSYSDRQVMKAYQRVTGASVKADLRALNELADLLEDLQNFAGNLARTYGSGERVVGNVYNTHQKRTAEDFLMDVFWRDMDKSQYKHQYRRFAKALRRFENNPNVPDETIRFLAPLFPQVNIALSRFMTAKKQIADGVNKQGTQASFVSIVTPYIFRELKHSLGDLRSIFEQMESGANEGRKRIRRMVQNKGRR
jgi:hypothetical protein